jgi:hypothetical protein
MHVKTAIIRSVTANGKVKFWKLETLSKVSQHFGQAHAFVRGPVISLLFDVHLRWKETQGASGSGMLSFENVSKGGYFAQSPYFIGYLFDSGISVSSMDNAFQTTW